MSHKHAMLGLIGLFTLMIILIGVNEYFDHANYTRECYRGFKYRVDSRGAMYLVSDDEGNAERCTSQ